MNIRILSVCLSILWAVKPGGDDFFHGAQRSFGMNMDSEDSVCALSYPWWWQPIALPKCPHPEGSRAYCELGHGKTWASTHTHCTGKPQSGWAGCFSKQKRQHTRDVQEDGQILSEHGEAQGCKIYLFPERRLGFQRLTYLFVVMKSFLVYLRHEMTSWSYS